MNFKNEDLSPMHFIERAYMNAHSLPLWYLWYSQFVE